MRPLTYGRIMKPIGAQPDRDRRSNEPPEPPPDLFGRDREYEAFFESISSAGLVQIVGAPGCGTSHFLESVLAAFDPSRILFGGAVHLEDRPSRAELDHQLRHRLDELDDGACGPRALGRVLECAPGDIATLDLRCGTSAAPNFFEDLLGELSSTTLVIASQEHQQILHDAALLRLGGLDVDAGVELLKRRLAVTDQSASAFGSPKQLYELVRLVGGHPFALEAAAVLAGVMDAADIIQRWNDRDGWLFGDVEQGLRARFHASLEHSWRRLPPDAQECLRQLAPLTAEFPTSLVEALPGEQTTRIETLERLRRRSWIRRENNPDYTAFSIPSVLRRFAIRQRDGSSEDDPGVQGAVATFASEKIDQLAEQLETTDSDSACVEFRAREGFFLDAAERSRRHAPERAAQILAGVSRFAPICSEVKRVCTILDSLLERRDQLSIEWELRSLVTLVELLRADGETDRAEKLAATAFKRVRSSEVGDGVWARVLLASSHSVIDTDPTEALSRLDEALERARNAPPRLQARICTRIGYCALRNFELDRAREAFEKARRLLAGRDDPLLRTELSKGLGYVHFRLDRHSSSIASFEEALEREQVLECEPRIADAHFNLGSVLLDTGRRSDARRHLEASRTGWSDADAHRKLPLAFIRLGTLLAEEGKDREARESWRRAIRMTDRHADRHNRAVAEGLLGIQGMRSSPTDTAPEVFEQSLQDLAVWRSPARAAVFRVAADVRRSLSGAAPTAPSDSEPRVSLGGLYSLVSEQDRRLRQILVSFANYRRRILEAAGEKSAEAFEDRIRSEPNDPEEPERNESPQRPEATHTDLSKLACAEARLLNRVVERRLDERPRDERFGPAPGEARRVLHVHPKAHWFRIDDGSRIDLTSRKPLRRVLRAIVETSTRDRRDGVTVPELVDAGWPEQNPTDEAGASRVYNVIRMLREKGLSEIVVTGEEGYTLDLSEVHVRIPHSETD